MKRMNFLKKRGVSFDYVILAIENGDLLDDIFLKTIIPSRKITEKYKKGTRNT